MMILLFLESNDMNFPKDMTLLDWFAGQALVEPETLTREEVAAVIGIDGSEWDDLRDWPRVRAIRAYQTAQEMMRVRDELLCRE